MCDRLSAVDAQLQERVAHARALEDQLQAVDAASQSVRERCSELIAQLQTAGRTHTEDSEVISRLKTDVFRLKVRRHATTPETLTSFLWQCDFVACYDAGKELRVAERP